MKLVYIIVATQKKNDKKVEITVISTIHTAIYLHISADNDGSSCFFVFYCFSSNFIIHVHIQSLTMNAKQETLDEQLNLSKVTIRSTRLISVSLSSLLLCFSLGTKDLLFSVLLLFSLLSRSLLNLLSKTVSD